MVIISRLLAPFIIVVTLNCHVLFVESNNRVDTTIQTTTKNRQQQRRRLDDHTVTPSLSMTPTVSMKPSAQPSLSMSPSLSVVPSAKPSLSMMPSLSINPSSKPTISMMPSSKSNKPSISHAPSLSTAPSRAPSKKIVVNETIYNDTFNYAMILNLGPATNTTRRHLSNTTYKILESPQQKIFCDAITANATPVPTCKVTNQVLSNSSLHVHYQLNVTAPTLESVNGFNIAYLTLLAKPTWGTQFLQTLNNATIATPHTVQSFALDYTLDACLCTSTNTTLNGTNTSITSCLPTPYPPVAPKEQFRLCLWTNDAAAIDKITHYDLTVGHADPAHGTTVNLITNGVLGTSVTTMMVTTNLSPTMGRGHLEVKAVTSDALYDFKEEGLTVATAHGKVGVTPHVATTATSRRRGRRMMAGATVEKNFSVDVPLNFTKPSGGGRMGWSVGVGILSFLGLFVTTWF